MLINTLEKQRALLLHKCEGLTGEQLATQAAEPSTLSLLGLLRHLTDVERSWFRTRLVGEDLVPVYFTEDRPNRDFDDGTPEGAEDDFGRYLEEVELVRAVIDSHDLDDSFYSARRHTELTLRWIVLHMIAEYAQHNGHADLLRERIDGTTDRSL